MDDETHRHALTRQLSQEEFAKFLDDRVTNRICPACGTDAWKIQLDNENDAVFAGSLPDQALDHYVPVVHVNCKNCGLVRSFDREVIAKWSGDL